MAGVDDVTCVSEEVCCWWEIGMCDGVYRNVSYASLYAAHYIHCRLYNNTGIYNDHCIISDI